MPDCVWTSALNLCHCVALGCGWHSLLHGGGHVHPRGWHWRASGSPSLCRPTINPPRSAWFISKTSGRSLLLLMPRTAGSDHREPIAHTRNTPNCKQGLRDKGQTGSSWVETLEEKGAAEFRNTGKITGAAAPWPQRWGSTPEVLSILSLQQSQGGSQLLGSGPALTVDCDGKPPARPCEVTQTHFVAMLECTNQELF